MLQLWSVTTAALALSYPSRKLRSGDVLCPAPTPCHGAAPGINSSVGQMADLFIPCSCFCVLMMIPLDPVSSAIDILGQVPVRGHLGLVR